MMRGLPYKFPNLVQTSRRTLRIDRRYCYTSFTDTTKFFTKV